MSAQTFVVSDEGCLHKLECLKEAFSLLWEVKTALAEYLQLGGVRSIYFISQLWIAKQLILRPQASNCHLSVAC